MNYACRSSRPFSTTKRVSKKSVLSDEAKSRRNYIRARKFTVIVDPGTKAAEIKVEKRS